MRWLAIALGTLALSNAALGQQQITIQVDGTNQIWVSPRDCESFHSVSWTMTLSATLICKGPTFWITSSNSCSSDGPSGSDYTLTPAPSTADRSGTFTSLRLRDILPSFTQTDGGIPCGSQAELTHRVCGLVKYSTFACGTNEITLQQSTPALITYLGNPPDTPTNWDVLPQDSALSIAVEAPRNAVTIHVRIRVAAVGGDYDAGTSDFVERLQFSASLGSGKIDGLDNGTTYEVQVQAEDAASNLSGWSESRPGTPLASQGFYGTYRNMGGTETGGCGGALPGVLGVPLLLGGYRVLRRKRLCRHDS